MVNDQVLRDIERFIEDHQMFMVLESSVHKEEVEYNLTSFLEKHRRPNFQQVLFQYIDDRNLKDSHVYKKAGLDRRHFSKIRTNPDYSIRKNTAIALALALELPLEETEHLLDSAGFSLSKSDTADLVILYCIEHQIYNLHDVNLALDHFDVRPLTGSY